MKISASRHIAAFASVTLVQALYLKVMIRKVKAMQDDPSRMQCVICMSITLLMWSILPLSGQSVFDIHVDAIYTDDGGLALINHGEISPYLCEITAVSVRDFEHQIILECEEDDNFDERSDILDTASILQFTRTSEVVHWLQTRQFVAYSKSSVRSCSVRHSLIPLNSHFITYIRDAQYGPDSTWGREDMEIWNFCILRVNKQFHIVLLVDEDDAYPSMVIVPMMEGGLVLNATYAYTSTDRTDHEIPGESHFEPADLYRIRNVKGGYQLYDKLFQEPLLPRTYDSISISRHHVVAKLKDSVHIYNTLLDLRYAQRAQAAYDQGDWVQILSNDRLLRLTPDGILHDTLPMIRYAVCGNYTSVERHLHHEGDTCYEVRVVSNTGDVRQDTFHIQLGGQKRQIQYLDGHTGSYLTEYSDLHTVYSLPWDYYIYYTSDSGGIMQVSHNLDSIRRSVYGFRGVAVSTHERDSLEIVVRNIPVRTSITRIFEAEDIEFYPAGYFQPIKFRIGDLYGYFPLHQNVLYAELHEFNGYFAKYVKPNGSRGWVDLYGNEYSVDNVARD